MQSPDVYRFHDLRRILNDLGWDKKRKIPLRPSAGEQRLSGLYTNPLLYACHRFARFYVPHPVGQKPPHGWVYGKVVFEKLLDTFGSRGFDLVNSHVLSAVMGGHPELAGLLVDRGASAMPMEGALTRPAVMSLFALVEGGERSLQGPVEVFLDLLDRAGQDWDMPVFSGLPGAPPVPLVEALGKNPGSASKAQLDMIGYVEMRRVEKARRTLETLLPASSIPARSLRL